MYVHVCVCIDCILYVYASICMYIVILPCMRVYVRVLACMYMYAHVCACIVWVLAIPRMYVWVGIGNTQKRGRMNLSSNTIKQQSLLKKIKLWLPQLQTSCPRRICIVLCKVYYGGELHPNIHSQDILSLILTPSISSSRTRASNYYVTETTKVALHTNDRISLSTPQREDRVLLPIRR